jgi:hypothetical protein
MSTITIHLWILVHFVARALLVSNNKQYQVHTLQRNPRSQHAATNIIASFMVGARVPIPRFVGMQLSLVNPAFVKKSNFLYKKKERQMSSSKDLLSVSGCMARSSLIP